MNKIVETIEEAVDLKQLLEDNILEEVKRYEATTGLYVDHIYLRSEENEQNQSRARDCEVSVKLQ